MVVAQRPGSDAARMLSGRHPEAPVACIIPDLTVQPVIVEGTGMIYTDARRTYVGKLRGGCPELKRGRIAISRGVARRLCRNDPVRVRDPLGADFGFCTFESFTPYVKDR